MNTQTQTQKIKQIQVNNIFCQMIEQNLRYKQYYCRRDKTNPNQQHLKMKGELWFVWLSGSWWFFWSFIDTPPISGGAIDEVYVDDIANRTRLKSNVTRRTMIFVHNHWIWLFRLYTKWHTRRFTFFEIFF